MDFDTAKTLAGIGAILASFGMFTHGILTIVGIVLFLIGMINLAEYLNDNELKSNIIHWFIFALIAAIVIAIGAFIFVLNAGLLLSHLLTPAPPNIPYPQSTQSLLPTLLPIITTAAIIIALAGAFYVISAIYLRKAMNNMYTHTGENLLTTGGLLYLIGAILTFIVVGLVIILVAWIIIGIAILTAKPIGKTQNI
ncbi:hypothetical protein VMUT_1182 [Vulcanisaeta moutnovskia 768-28]|uniref:DUF996 domain-containing protein n=1 Tax=Vulcanisaeta moutnovskia (strain 768-28) TaxID=985053 RepID=F0QYF4_VULM7|nr:DUF996 domain-containing protein [Vulcanisaeta moutnovskia]ADY01387.1 hypothetical protein VMUT_1182 [Vulcanisaeta moutnovskia 768-28]